MNKVQLDAATADSTNHSTKAEWVRPEVRKLTAGSAELNATGVNDGGPVGNARS